MKIRGILLAAVSALALLAPVSAQADHCESDLIIYSFPPGIYANGLACLVAGQDMDDLGVDGRILYPGADQIQVRYTVDLGPSVTELTAVVNGLGFVDHEVVMRRGEAGPGIFFYTSTFVSIPAGRTTPGCITATVEAVDDTTTFAHPGATCG